MTSTCDEAVVPAHTAARAATLFAQAAMHTLATRTAFHAALCGGPMLAAVFDALARLPAYRRIDWRHVHVYAIDDTWDEAALQALAACPVPADNVLRPPVADVTRHDAARRYEQRLAASFSLHPGDVPVFDFVLLAGHRRDARAAANVARLVVAHERGRPGVALSLPVIESARCVVVACEV